MVLLVFAVGSVVCALAGSLGVLVLGRVIQGAGGGIFPLAFGIIRETFPAERVATAIGGLSATFGIGGGVGLVIAGPIVSALGPSWLFWLGLIAVPAAFAIFRYVPQEATHADARVDWLGAVPDSSSLRGCCGPSSVARCRACSVCNSAGPRLRWTGSSRCLATG